tara:strand:+ start:558 stop:1022 length:465 start_codon:yes stop_codon:yes gene_type:complete
MNKIKTLRQIVNFVIIETGQNIRNKTRLRDVNDARAVYYKIARETTHFSLDKIGEYVGKHHSSVIHSLKNVFPTVMISNENCRKAYNKYNGILDISDEENFNEVQALKNKVEELEYNLEEHERLFRELSDDNKEKYRTRVMPIIKMLNYNELNQ